MPMSNSPNHNEHTHYVTEFEADSRVMDRFTLKKFLGYGSFQEEYWLARNEVRSEDVTLHFLPKFLRFNDQAQREIEDEVLQNLCLEHPHILRSIDFIRSGGLSAIEMESLGDSAKSLRAYASDLQARGQALTREEIKPWIRTTCCEALSYAHNHHSRAHGDLRPEVIFFGEDNHLKLAGFGVNRVMGNWASLSGDGFAQGKEAYLSGCAPELENTKAIPSIGGDLYGVGAMLYAAILGKPPGRNLEAVKNALDEVDMTEKWKEEILRCLDPSPQARPKSAYEIGSTLSTDDLLHEPSRKKKKKKKTASVKTNAVDNVATASPSSKKPIQAIAALLFLPLLGFGAYKGFQSLQDKPGQLAVVPDDAPEPELDPVTGQLPEDFEDPKVLEATAALSNSTSGNTSAGRKTAPKAPAYASIESFVDDYYVKSESDHASDLLPFYADRVENYYGSKNVNHLTILNDRKSFIRKYPTRSYTMQRDPDVSNIGRNRWRVETEVTYIAAQKTKSRHRVVALIH